MSEVIKQGFCIGCGNCETNSPNCFSMEENKLGLIQAKLIDDAIDIPNFDKICPVISEKSEDFFNQTYQSDSLAYKKEIGFYRNVYAGFVNDEASRLESSSGGLTTHVIEELFERGLITGAIVVGASSESKSRTEYSIIRSAKELNQSKKSKYHMTSHSEIAMRIMENSDQESLVFVGIPCSVKAIKLLGEEYPEFKKQIKYTISVFCGHQKSHAFTEFVAWQMDISPPQLDSIDYRIKQSGGDASRYYYKAASKELVAERRVDSLKWMDWGLGLFKPKACDFCDDVTGETADVIFGDAWSRKYSQDYRGTNLVITRTKEMDDILASSHKRGLISLFNEDVGFVFATQGGNFRHRHEGLVSRKAFYEKEGLWFPPKNQTRMARYSINSSRNKYYLDRHKISLDSHEIFLKAKELNDLEYFWKTLAPQVSSYYKKSVTLPQKLKRLIKTILRRA
ncbi:Coenzyme F420 hydrogenase/dehydrogenase, beta subunit C-terminal domain [Pseudomonas silesiensis]|uniref:Coenzyme F420 hydrogenase/dehydrogenase, beta subunit C-terminal domain n=1 Tax=Pseudomonas silesiensis TaxID=1853130 RepID=UPI0030D18048